MKIYEGTDGLRGLITKLIEVWDFKKIVYEGEGATLSTNDVVFNLWVTDEVFLRGLRSACSGGDAFASA